MADEVHGRKAESPDHGLEVFHVLTHRIVGAVRDRRIRPVIAPAVGDGAKARSERPDLRLPCPMVADRSVNEQNRLAVPFLDDLKFVSADGEFCCRSRHGCRPYELPLQVTRCAEMSNASPPSALT